MLEVLAAFWLSGNIGGTIEGLQPTATPNVYLIVPSKNQDPEFYPPYPYPNDRVEFIYGPNRTIARLKWRDKTYFSIGKTSSAWETFARWENEQVLAGEYTAQGGRKYSFSGSGEARWPDRTFSYSMEAGLRFYRAPNCDFIQVKSKKYKREYIGFRWENGRLLIFHPEPITVEDGHPPLVPPGGEAPFKCSSKPFLVLTPVKGGRS